jgi:hypothetical protein
LEIARFMRNLEGIWDEHVASVRRGDLAGSLANLVADPSFTHDREMPWLLPEVAPTHERAEVLAIAVVSFARGRISSQRVLWDHATLSTQLGSSAPRHLRR